MHFSTPLLLLYYFRPAVLDDFRTPKLIVEFFYNFPEDEAAWKKLYCRRPVAFRGLQLRARERGAGPVPLPHAVLESLSEEWVTALVVPVSDEGGVRAKLRGSTLFPRRLTVRFDADDSERDDYLILLGTAAWLADAELRGYFAWKARVEEQDAIII